MTNSTAAVRSGFYPEVNGAYDADLEPFASLFLKPFTHNKSAFTKRELERMCKDPMHSPRLIIYLIDFIKTM
ncbi:MAG: hypothetical protein A2Z71_09885 [Chloroflexi bacterium RBG_13_50_21]|nr:MAG: hypothetical protein A2Z71_09885 [Chloroflexi bacterium RBG_13_50_21]